MSNTKSKYETEWEWVSKFGSIKRIHFKKWWARPTLGMNNIKSFDNEEDAIAYAKTGVSINNKKDFV